MKKVLVTGSKGFIGKNLLVSLRRVEDVEVVTFDSGDGPLVLEKAVRGTDFIFHLAGVNRPKEQSEFEKVNFLLTEEIVSLLSRQNRLVPLVFTSSTQASRENPYGISKCLAEKCLLQFNRRTGAPISIYRLPGVFGKWSRPNYNTVVATFCHNIARDLPVSISDPENEIELVYIDDVVEAFLGQLNEPAALSKSSLSIEKTFFIKLGDLARKIEGFREIGNTLVVPDLQDDLTKYLHATYLSFLPKDEFSKPVKMFSDNRGWLFELLKSRHFGQIFVSKTFPGVTRGNHYHHTKIEKFCLIQGNGVIRFKEVLSGELLEYPVDDNEIQVVDIPPGYAHSIENIGEGEMIVLFWSNQIFDPEKPDTYSSEVNA